MAKYFRFVGVVLIISLLGGIIICLLYLSELFKHGDTFTILLYLFGLLVAMIIGPAWAFLFFSHADMLDEQNKTSVSSTKGKNNNDAIQKTAINKQQSTNTKSGTPFLINEGPNASIEFDNNKYYLTGIKDVVVTDTTVKFVYYNILKAINCNSVDEAKKLRDFLLSQTH